MISRDLVCRTLIRGFLLKMATSSVLPYFVKGLIVKGFGRGSKELGFPTANFPDDVTENLPEGFGCGVYCGWASVDCGEVYKMVMSVGYNPFYQNTAKTMETHVLHSFNKDLHGSQLKVCILHYLRREKCFSTLEDLKEAIRQDINQAEGLLENPTSKAYKSDPFFLAKL